MPRVITGSSRIAVMCVLAVTTLIAACGGGTTSEGCPRSSKEEPLSNLSPVSCKNWDLRLSTATLVPNDVILQANMFNDVSDFKSWIVVEADLKYKGTGTGRIGDVISSSSSLVGSKNLIYRANDETPTFSELKDAFPPIPYNASSPYSGGVVTISMWFWVDNDDSDFVLGLFVGDKEADEPNLWIDVSTSDASDEGVSEGAVSEGVIDCVSGLEDMELSLEGCDFSNREFISLSFNPDPPLYTSNSYDDSSILYNRNLSYANFSGATLHGRLIDCSNLTGANLEGATIRSIYGNFVNFSGANLRGANLSSYEFNGTTDDGTPTSGVGATSLYWANFANADLRGANFSDVYLGGANLTGALFDETTFDDANMTDVVYDDPFWTFESNPEYKAYCKTFLKLSK